MKSIDELRDNSGSKKAGETAILLKLFNLAFVEIRAAETLDKARIIADLFHNAPMGLRARPNETREILDELKTRAERQGTQAYLESLLTVASAT